MTAIEHRHLGSCNKTMKLPPNGTISAVTQTNCREDIEINPVTDSTTKFTYDRITLTNRTDDNEHMIASQPRLSSLPAKNAEKEGEE
jgi:hypothetical protein